MITLGIGFLKKNGNIDYCWSCYEKDDDLEETVGDDFKGENENESELLQEQEEGVRSLFDLFEQKLL